MQAESIQPTRCGRPELATPSRSRVIALATSLWLGAACAAAAGWDAAEFNPQPAAGDVILPMPCDGAMTFRRIEVPSDGPLSDRLIHLGGDDPERGALEGTRPAYVSGDFSDTNKSRYYLIGKYEVSRRQYHALDASCAQPTSDDRLAQADVSWFDAVSFGDRYSVWLRANATAKLPVEDKEPGFVRLPTEVEWEFAARGGIGVSESDFRERTFVTSGDIPQHAWVAGNQSANGKVQRIGLLKPNPLGLHDVLGNLDEIVFDPFQLNKLDRLHGQVGGFIVRGGNFTTSEDDTRSAYRQEIPYYQGAEARRSATTGFRLAVVSRVVTSRDRLQAINKAWGALGSDSAGAKPLAAPLQASDEPLADPVADLGALAAATQDPKLGKRLLALQLAFRASFQARDEQRDRAAKTRLRLGTFLCQKLKDDGQPLDQRRKIYDACVQGRGADDERCRSQHAGIESEELILWENLRYYVDTIVSLAEDYPEDVVGRQLAVLHAELAARGVKALEPVADLYVRHVSEYRKGGNTPRARWLSDCKSLRAGGG